jgi:hypothetical protein
MSKLKKSTLTVLCVAALMSGFFTVLGGYVITSNHVSGTPTTPETLTLTANSTSPMANDVLQLTAHLSGSNAGGLAVTLKNNGNIVGLPVNTNTNGDAVFYWTITAPYDFVAQVTHP